MPSPQWTIKCYLDAQGQDVIEAWYDAQPPELQAKFDSRLHFLRQQPREKWVRPYFDLLKGRCGGLGEIRFEFKNVQYRPIGFFSGQLEFTLVLVATKKGARFDPSNACDLGNRRKNEIALDKGKSHACEF